jgi:hypothetical protein
MVQGLRDLHYVSACLGCMRCNNMVFGHFFLSSVELILPQLGTICIIVCQLKW